MPTSISDLWAAIIAGVPRDQWVPIDTIYDAVERLVPLDPDDLLPSALGNDDPTWRRNVRNALQTHKASDILWGERALYYFPSVLADRAALLRAETELRKQWLNELADLGSALEAEPELLRRIGIYGGAQGIWVDKSRTEVLTPDDTGITVGLLHTGEHYPDDLTETGLTYHYPQTSRPPGRDGAEVAATKAALAANVPVFVITTSESDHSLRHVRLGWIKGFDDEARHFLISFDEAAPPEPAAPLPDAAAFQPTQTRTRAARTAHLAERNPAFRFRVIRQYGPHCALCDIGLLEALDAVHIIPVEHSGSDDPRNGLVMCANHHRAFDADAFLIDPRTLAIIPSPPFSLHDLRITRIDLAHCPHKPHADALRWRWEAGHR